MKPGIALTLALCLLSGIAVAQGDPVTIGNKHLLQSAVLGEERAYWVHLPGSYGRGDQRYPVLFLLDGSAHFHSATGVVQFMSGGINGNTQVPEMIVVAIPNTDRTRDLTPTHTTIGFDGNEAAFLAGSGGGDAFLRFIKDELFPAIDAAYRTAPYRVLVGHSFGGLLAVHALLHAPEMFQAIIAIDPSMWWDGEKLVNEAKGRLDAAPPGQRAIYISLANNPPAVPGTPKKMELAGRKLGMILDSSGSPGLRSSLEYFDREDHGSVPLLSLYHGLLFVFDGFKPPTREFLADPASIAPHYAALSERLGLTILPPEGLINQLGYALLMRGDVDGAIEMFRRNVENYPGSANVHDSLGEAYMNKGKNKLAIESYERSLALDPTNTNATTKLEELRAR